MKLFQIKIKPNGPFMTNWHSDTLFGALCWAYLYRYGEKSLYELIQQCLAGEPPFVISDAFPEGLFPKPLIPASGTWKDELTLQQMQQLKEVKKNLWVSLEDFNRARQGKQIFGTRMPVPFITGLSQHNQVNRLTGTTGQNGELYSQEEVFLNERAYRHLCVLVRVLPDQLDQLITLFKEVGAMGIGARSSTGKGTFSVKAVEEFTGFGPLDQANGFIILGHVVPAKDEPTQGFYKTIIKRGRLGEARSNWQNPFKKPLVMLAPGSAFYGDPNRLVAGRMVTNIAPGADDAVHCGISLTVPAVLPATNKV